MGLAALPHCGIPSCCPPCKLLLSGLCPHVWVTYVDMVCCCCLALRAPSLDAGDDVPQYLAQA